MKLTWIILLTILAPILIFAYQPIIPAYAPIKHDPRLNELKQFMDKHKFKQPYYIKDYVSSADKNGIDFRTVAVIDLLESSGGWHYPADTNNRWGYGSSSSLRTFASVSEGIDFVSTQLAENHYYKGKTLEAQIKTYNPPSVNPAYYPNFIKLFNEIK